MRTGLDGLIVGHKCLILLKIFTLLYLSKEVRKHKDTNDFRSGTRSIRPNQGRRKEKEKGKGLEDSCPTHTTMQTGGWQREASDNSTWSSWSSPVAENFSFRDSFEPEDGIFLSG